MFKILKRKALTEYGLKEIPWRISLFLFNFFFLLKTFSLYAQDLDFLIESYDPNTEISIKGEVVQLYIPERGIVYLHIFINGKIYKVFLCPSWYYRELNADLIINDQVEIKGAKIYTPKHGVVFVVKSLKNLRTQREYLFRTEGFAPIWRGKGRGRPFK